MNAICRDRGLLYRQSPKNIVSDMSEDPGIFTEVYHVGLYAYDGASQALHGHMMKRGRNERVFD